MVTIALAFVLVSTAVNALPDFGNYTQIPGVSFEGLCIDGTRSSDDQGEFGCDGHGSVAQGTYYSPMAPDPTQTHKLKGMFSIATQ